MFSFLWKVPKMACGFCLISLFRKRDGVAVMLVLCKGKIKSVTRGCLEKHHFCSIRRCLVRARCSLSLSSVVVGTPHAVVVSLLCTLD